MVNMHGERSKNSGEPEYMVSFVQILKRADYRADRAAQAMTEGGADGSPDCPNC